MRSLVVAAILLTNAAFVGDRGPVTVGRPGRKIRVLVPAADLSGWRGLRDRDTGVVVRLWGGSIVVVTGLPRAFAGLKVSARVYDLQLTERFSRDVVADVPADWCLQPIGAFADWPDKVRQRRFVYRLARGS